MAYSARLRKAVGAVRSALEQAGLGLQSPEFARHGVHEPAVDAPLVLVACSGGRDSMALAAVARTVCASLGLRCGAVIVDHGLQPGSAGVAALATDRCRALGLDPVTVSAVEVRDGGEGLESAAREARYGALCAAARVQGAAAVLLAHTMDDQAETVLIGLLRSRGLDALAGMPRRFRRGEAGQLVQSAQSDQSRQSVQSGQSVQPGQSQSDQPAQPGTVLFLRPLLELTRAETTGICRDLGLDYWDDPTNGESQDGPLPAGYPLRSRVRHDLLPAIERFAGGDVARRFAESARLARLDKEYLDARADEVMAGAVTIAAAAGDAARPSVAKPVAGHPDSRPDNRPGENPDNRPDTPPTGAPAASGTAHAASGTVLAIDARRLEGESAAIRLRVIAHALERAGIGAGAAQVEAVDRLVTDWHGQGPIQLPRGYSVNRKKHVIRVCQDGPHANR